MVYAFKIRIDLYESLYIENIDFDDNSNLNQFFEKYNKNKHILVIELINNDTLNFLVEIKQMNNKYKCMRCNREINNINEKYNCSICNYSLFCSKRCANATDSHKILDRELKTLIEPKFNLTDLLNFDFYSLLHNGTKLGRTGLNNIGSTSYMISVLQCLSKTLDLTKYFLRENYLQEINRSNSLGSKGEISKQYYKLLYQMFNGNNDYVNPEELRQAFIKKLYKYKNNEIQDSHEFLLSFLDTLHEDLNRVTIKKYKEIKE
jgi:DNA-directed RNA polymerase subunit RPC12/RpoP